MLSHRLEFVHATYCLGMSRDTVSLKFSPSSSFYNLSVVSSVKTSES